jgi:hypothetical protein
MKKAKGKKGNLRPLNTGNFPEQSRLTVYAKNKEVCCLMDIPNG